MLRSKIEKNPEKPRWILTVHGVGYRLEGRVVREEKGKRGKEGKGIS
jgi:DNA-binding winged helix-turn-helix (wHTH) protein